MPLPDVPQAEYDTYLADQFTERTNRRIDDLQGSGNFLASSSRRIASLGVEPIEVASATSPLIGQAPVFVPPQRLPPIPTMPQMPGRAPAGAAPTPSPMPPPAPPLPPMGGPNMAGPAPSFVQEPPAQQVPLPGPSRPAGEPVPVTPLVPLVPGPFAQPQPPRPQAPPTAPPPAPTPAPFAQDGSYQSYARQAADRAGIDPSVFVAQIQQESGFNPNAGSPAGALGIAQIVPRYHPGVDPKDPYASLDYAAGLMSRLLRQYNGDWTKALVAYNGGGGAVAAWDRGEPYAESQTYVAKILGGERPTAAAPPTVAAPTTARAVPTAMAQSQFGDRELTASEAYAACGPAAAVRFAQAYGRNPTLREATDLAATVGWTPESGMAGIASEQRLMQKLGLDTRLVGGPQWNQFAAEAQSGNPITISTPGHYFYADGYNPSSGAFHVGQSGLDLRGGKEWMTPSDMERLMGAAQGALFANNPTVPDSSSVTAGTTRELDDVRRQISSSFGAAPVPPVVQRPPIESADPQVRRLDQAVEMAYLPPQPRRAPEPATAPLAAPSPPGPGSLDHGLRAIADAIQGALRSLGGGAPGGPGGGGDGRDEDRYGNRRVPTPEPGTFDPSQPLDVDISPPTLAQRAQADVERFRHLGGNLNLPELPLPELGLPDLTPPKDPLEALQRAQTDALRRGLPSPGPTGQLSILDPKLGNPLASEETGIGEGVVRGVAGELSRAGERGGARAAPAAASAVERMPASVLEDFRRYAGDLADTSTAPPLNAAERAGLAARDPGYLAGTPERAAEDLIAGEATRQGSVRPNVTAEQIQGLPGMAGASRDLNDFRSAVEAGLPFKDWYSAFSNWVLEMVGKDNLPEALAIFAQTSPNNPVPTNAGAMISMMRAVRQVEREGAWDLASVREYMRNFIGKDEKLNIREFGRQGSDGGNATMQRIWQLVNGEDGAFATRENVGKLMQGYLDGFIPQAANAKTSSYYENLMNSLVQVYDHFSTNDTWMGQIFGPKGTFKADDPNWYRSMYGLINRVAREMGLPAREIQAAAWTAYRSLMDDNLGARPEVIKTIAQQVKNGSLTLAEGIRRAERTGYYRDLLRSGTEFSKANDLPGALSEVYANPKFQAALENARNAGIDLKSPPPADVIRGITVEHPGAPTTAAQQRPFPVQGAERAAGQEFYRERAPGIMLPSLERAGYDPETGRIPSLGNVIHEVEQHGSGGTVRLPGGNADTAQFAAARLGQDLDLPEVALHLPDSTVQTTAGLALDAPGGFRPEQIDSITRALDEARATYTVTPGRQVRVFDFNGEGQDWARSTVEALRKADTTGGTLSAYAGDTTRISQADYGGILGRVGDRYGTPGSPGVPRGTVSGLATRSTQYERAPYAGVAARERVSAATDATAGARAALADPDVGAAVAEVLGGAQPAFGTPNFAVHVAGAASGGFLANLYTDENDPNRGAKIAAGVASGYAGGRIATTIATRGSAAAGRGLSRSAPEQAWDAWVRRYADKNVDLNRVQEDFKRITGRPWTDAMSLAHLARVDPSNRALVATQNAVGQAIQRVQRAGTYDSLSKLVSLESDIATAEGLGTRAERDFLRGGIAENTTRRMADARKDLDAAQLDYARALADQRAAASGVRPTRDSTRLAASEQRVRDAQQALTDATDAAREAQAAQAAESMYQSPAGMLVRPPETRDLTIAESDVARLTRRYEGMHSRNPENPKLPSVARQLGYAEDRLSRIRQHLGEVMPERESAVTGRAGAAADQARTRPQVSPTPELAAARVRMRYEQRNLERLQAEQARGQQGLDEALARAHRSFLEAERDVNVATADLPAAARAQGFAQKTGRIFEGGQRYDDLVAERDALERSFAARPEQWAQVRKAADDLFDYRKVLLEEMVDSRLITRDEASNLVDLYPKWTPTRMIDYMYAAGEGGGMRRGDKISVSSNGLRRYTEEGYAGERENRIASLFREAWDVYARGAQNRSFNAFVNYVEEARPSNMKRIARDMDEWAAHGGTSGDLLNPNYRPKVGRGEVTITGMRDGVKQEWVTDDPYLKAAVEMAPDSPLSGIMGKAWRAGSQLVTETATSRNPKWLAKNVMRDAGTYLIGTMAEGGVRGNLLPLASTYGPAMATYLSTDPNDPNRLQKALAAGAAGYLARSAPGINRAFGPNLLGEMLAGYADAFSGIASGTFTGRGTQEYLLRGGGMRGGTLSRAGIEGGERLAGMIRNPGGIRISNMNDLSRLLKDAATFGWVKAIGSRLELGPRVAAMRVAEARGASPLEAMIAGRDVTLDFDRGGLWTKEVNRYIPFMNAAAQGGLRFTRLARDHPGGMFLAGSALVGGPTLAAMQWNRGDATRSADYDDVQDYIKSRGPVLMLPWVGTDKDGNRQPLHLDFDMAQFAPFAVAAQEAYDRAQGKQGRGAGELASSIGGAIVPGGASNPVDAATQILPVPFSTAAQLGLNRDFYRGSTIANRFSDERATALAQAAAPAIEAGVTRIPGLETARIRPSQVDFAVRDILGGAGQTATEVGNAGRPPRVPGAPSETPVVGGLASGFLRTGGGQQFENVRQPTQMLHQNVRQRLRELGGSTQYYEPSVVPDQIQKIPLRQAEQAEYQRLTNEYFNEAMERLLNRPSFSSSERLREKWISEAMDTARQRAQFHVLGQIRRGGSSVIQRRTKQSSAP